MPLTFLSHASTIGFCRLSSSSKYPFNFHDGMLNVADTVSPTCALHSGTTTLIPCLDSPTQPYSVVTITVTSSVTCVGIKFHGVTVKTIATAMPAIIADKSNRCDSLPSFCFCLYIFSQLTQRKNKI